MHRCGHSNRAGACPCATCTRTCPDPRPCECTPDPAPRVSLPLQPSLGVPEGTRRDPLPVPRSAETPPAAPPQPPALSPPVAPPGPDTPEGERPLTHGKPPPAPTGTHSWGDAPPTPAKQQRDVEVGAVRGRAVLREGPRAHPCRRCHPRLTGGCGHLGLTHGGHPGRGGVSTPHSVGTTLAPGLGRRGQMWRLRPSRVRRRNRGGA